MTTEEQILKGAEELFFRYGIKGITMDDVAKHLSMSKRTIYEKFPNKDAIIEILLKQHLTKSEKDFNAFRESSSNAIEEVFMTLQCLNRLFESVNPHLLLDLKKFYPEVWQEFMDFKKTALMENLVSNMKRGIKEGLYRDDIDVKILAILRIEEMELAWNPDIYPPSEFAHVKVQISLLEHFLYGITNVKGHNLAEKYKKQIKA